MADYRVHGLTLNDRAFECHLCGSTRFEWREVKLQTTGASFMGMDWANSSADGAVCQGCGYVHLFYGEHHRFTEVPQ